jgi:hypothetical protein
MERKWYYAVDGVRHGPVTFEELRALVVGGTLKALDLVWQPDFGPEWRNVGQVRALFEAPAQEAPPLVADERKVPLLGVTGARPSCLAAASQAYARVVEVLFKPFDISRWFSMGFCAWLAYIGTQSGNFNGLGEGNPGVLKEQIDTFLDKLSDASAHPGVVASVVLLLVLALLFGLWLCSLRSRGDFMFLHRWYRPDAPIRQCWLSSRAAAHELFVWRVSFFFIALLLFALDGVYAYVQIVRPYLDADKVWSDALVRPTVACVTVAVLLSIGVQLVAHLGKAFVVPVMYWHGVTAPRAWLVVFALCNQYPFAVLGYLACGLGFLMMAVMGGLAFVACTCCIGIIPLALPYLSGVVLLPVYLFFRGYAVCFLSQWRAELVPAEA